METWQVIMLTVYFLIGVIVQFEPEDFRTLRFLNVQDLVFEVILRVGVAIFWFPILVYLFFRNGPSKSINSIAEWAHSWIHVKEE